MPMSTVVGTRAQLVAELRVAMQAKFDEIADTIEGGPLDGIRVVSAGNFGDVLSVFDVRLPAPSEHEVEVSTPATVHVAAVCPKCDIPNPITLLVSPELRVDDTGSELRIKARAKARLHVCGQLPLPEEAEAGDQQAFELDDIVRPEDQLSADEQAQADIASDAAADEEARDQEIAGLGAFVPKVGDPVVLVGLKYRIRSIEDGVATVKLSFGGPTDAITVETASLGWDDVAGVWRPDEELTSHVDDEPRCEGSNHVPGCEHFPGAGTKAEATSDVPDDDELLPF